jgi:hypothetical protein
MRISGRLLGALAGLGLLVGGHAVAWAQDTKTDCSVKQAPLAWDGAAGRLVLVQNQDCTTRIAPLVFWVVDTKAWELKGPFSHRRGAEPATLRDRLAFAVGSYVSVDAGEAPGILMPHGERDKRKAGLFGSPFFPDGATFQPSGLPKDEAATALCLEKHPATTPNATVEGGGLPGGDLYWCSVTQPEGRANATYVFLHRGEPAAELSLRSALNRYHARVLKLEEALRETEVKGFGDALVAACKEADPALWDRAKESVANLLDGVPLKGVLLDPELCPDLHRAVEAKKAVPPSR